MRQKVYFKRMILKNYDLKEYEFEVCNQPKKLILLKLKLIACIIKLIKYPLIFMKMPD